MAARTALQTPAQTNRKLETTANPISAGLRVGTAQDHAAYWSVATTIRSDNAALSTVQDALGAGSATLDVAYNTTGSAIDVVNEIKQKLVAAREPGADNDTLQSEITQLQNTLRSLADASVFAGENWLSVDSGVTGYSASKPVVASFTRIAGAISIATITIDTAPIKLYDADTTGVGILDGSRDASGALSSTGTFALSTMTIAALTDSAADTATLDSYIAGADAAIVAMTMAASTLGEAKSRIDLQKDFVAALTDAIERGVSQLVDADMTEESTRLQALQVQAELGIQALSIANQSSQDILALFQ
jgi:flagellin